MGKEARINAKKRAARMEREKALFDKVVKRITAQNPHIFCEVFCVDSRLFHLVREKTDDLELQICVREFCRLKQVVNIYHMTYGEDAHGAPEVRHQCILYSLADESTHGAGKLCHAALELFQFSALVNNLSPETGDES